MILILSIPIVLGSIYLLYRHSKTQRLLLSAALPTEENLLQRLQPKISWCRFLENVGHYGQDLSVQYKTVVNLYHSSIEVLEQKFNVNELTFSRYENTINATNQILIDNILKMLPLLETLDNIKASELENQKSLTDKIDSLYAMNSELLQKMNELIVNLSAIKSLTGPDESTTKYLLENLDKLIERARHY
jgi:hypothetical protein